VSPYTVEIAFFRQDHDVAIDVRVYDASLAILPDEESVARQAVADSRRDIVRYSAFRKNSRVTDQAHIHYFPTDEDDTSYWILTEADWLPTATAQASPIFSR
jgi:hypothetical protein